MKPYQLLIFLMLPFGVIAQKIPPRDTITKQIKFIENEKNQFYSDTVSSTLVLSYDLLLESNTDLSLNYQLKELDEFLKYNLVFELIDNAGNKLLPIKTQIENDQFSYLFKDVFENGLYYGQDYTANLICELEGMDCNDSLYVFDWSIKKNWSYYIPIVSGGAAFIVGAATRNNYESNVTKYLEFWEDGETAESIAEKELDKAKTKQRQSRNLLIGGGIAALAGGIGFLLKYRKHLPNKRRYEKYCGSDEVKIKRKKRTTSLQLQPSLEGLGIAFHF